jgi:hypothetical protein
MGTGFLPFPVPQITKFLNLMPYTFVEPTLRKSRRVGHPLLGFGSGKQMKKAGHPAAMAGYPPTSHFGLRLRLHDLDVPSPHPSNKQRRQNTKRGKAGQPDLPYFPILKTNRADQAVPLYQSLFISPLMGFTAEWRISRM